MRPSSDTQRPKRGDTDNHSTINPDDVDASDDLSRPAVQRQMDAPLPRSDIKKRIRGLIGSLRTFSNPLSRKRSAPQLPQSSTSLLLRDTATVPSLPPPHVTESPVPSFPPHNVTESPATPAPIFLPLPISRSRTAFNPGGCTVTGYPHKIQTPRGEQNLHHSCPDLQCCHPPALGLGP